jgi:hypothetical protein
MDKTKHNAIPAGAHILFIIQASSLVFFLVLLATIPNHCREGVKMNGNELYRSYKEIKAASGIPAAASLKSLHEMYPFIPGFFESNCLLNYKFYRLTRL